MSNFIIYDSTGFIIRVGSCPETMVDLQKQGSEFVLAGEANLYNDYILNGVVTARPTQSTSITGTTLLANGVATVTISGILNPTVVNTIVPPGANANNTIVVTDGTLVFSTTYPGTYIFTLSKFPYLPITYSVVAS